MTIDLELEKIDLYNTAYTFTGRMDETEILKIFQNKIHFRYFRKSYKRRFKKHV